MSSQSSASFSLFTLMKDVSEALNFDRLDRNEDAYRKYLQCVLKISTSLLKQLHVNDGHMFVTAEQQKMVKLGQQCMDRVARLVNEKLEKVPNSSVPAPGNLSLKSDPSSSRVLTPSTHTTPSPRETNHISSQITSPDDTTIISSFNMGLRNVFENSSLLEVNPSNKTTNSRKLGPLEVAARQNQQLLCAFQKRQALAKNRSTSTNLGLTLQRKMAENLAIAKAQEQALAKKMKERQQRLEEQAVRRFHTPMGLSEDELHQRQVYKRVLEFEQENCWLIELKVAFQKSPLDISVINELIVAVLRCDSHPLTQELNLYQCKLLDQITSLVRSKIHRIERHKVPLSKQVLEEAHLEAYKTSFHHSKSGLKLSQSEITLSDVTDDDVNGSNNAQDTIDNDQCTDNASYRELGDDKDSESFSEMAHIGDVTKNVQKDIKIALNEGSNVRQKLEEDNKILKSITKQITEGYDKYNQENLDDLFEDSDNEEDYTSDGNDGNEGRTLILSDSINVGLETPLENSCKKRRENRSANEFGSIDDQNLVDNTNNDREADLGKKTSCENVDSKIVQLKNEAYHRHLKGIIDDILMCIEKVHVLFVIVYEQLDSAEGRDQCNVLLEEYFFRPLWNNLLSLFRLANEPKEISLAYIMTLTKAYDPERFGVSEKLCLHGDGGLGDYPYQPAVMELMALCQCQTMLEKLDCLVRSSKQVMSCIEHFFKEKHEEVPGIGADDLIPILCYIISKTCLPQLVSECHAMDKFIHEGYIMGEEGYCLTSFQTAISYLISEGIALQ